MTILEIIGIGVFIFGGIWLLIRAFGTSLLWGLACLFLWPAAIAYAVFHWPEAKNPFLVQVVGFVIFCFISLSGA